MEQLMQKVADAIKEDFVGNYVFTDEELEKMYDFTGCLIRDYNNERGSSISKNYDELFFVAMVNAIKTWNSNEDTFFKHIYKKLVGSDGSQKIYCHLTDAVDRLGKNGKIMYLDGCTKKYYATILAHAFAPLNSTESFLELCWNLYSEDMNFTYTKNDEIFSLVAEELKRIFANEESLDDDFRLGSGVYSLRAGIKRMAIDSPDKMIQLIENTTLLLSRMFDGEIIDINSYYSDIVRKWWVEKEKNFGIVKPKRKAYNRAITDYSTIRPKYNFNGKQTVLTIPSIRLKSNFYDAPILNVYRNGELIDQRKMQTFGTGLTMATKVLDIYADNLLSINGIIDCSIEIIHCGETIYNSKRTLFRDYLLFREDHREIFQDECLPGNYILFAPHFENFSSYPESIKKKPYEPNIYVFNAKEGELLQNAKRTVLFVNEKQNRGIRIIADIKNNAKFLHDGEEFIVIDGELKVIVEADIDISNYGIRYEESCFKLKDFTCIEDEGARTFLITELISVCQPQKINIFSYTDNKIEASFNVVKFKSINIIFDKKLYFDDDNVGTVHFLTEKYDRTVSFDINQGDIIIPFDDGDVIISPPILRWKIDDGEFSTHYGENLWYKSFSNSAILHIDLPREMGYQIIMNNNNFLAEGTAFNSFKLGETLYSILGEQDRIIISARFENMEVIPILSICLREKMRYSPFKIIGKKLVWNSSKAFIGEDIARFRISFLKKDAVVYSFEFDDQKTDNYTSKYFSLDGLKADFYDIEVNLLKKIAFSEKTIKLFKQSIIYGDVHKIRFKGKCLKFDKVMLTGKSNYEKIQTFYADHLWYAGKYEGHHYYMGSIYIFYKGHKIYLNKMPNSNGGSDQINPVRLELRSETSCFIVAGVKYDDMNDFLGEFTLDTHNRISNFDRNTRGIDYFIFETEEAQINVQSSKGIKKHKRGIC